MLIYWSKLILIFFTDPLGLIKDAPISNCGVLRDLTECDDAKYVLFVLLSFSHFESSIAEYQQKFNVLNSSRK